MRDQIESLVNKRTWAVVGASNNHEKFGRRIFDRLKTYGYEVYAINPNEPNGLDDGSPAFASVQELPVVPAVVDVVVPPKFGAKVVDDCVAKGVPAVWFQPGAESPELVEYAKSKGLTVIWGGPCAMVEAKRWEQSV